MIPGTNRILWALCSLALCGMTNVLAFRFYRSDPLYGFGNEAAFWLFLVVSVVVGFFGTYLLLIGFRERNQFRRTAASISAAPEHNPASPTELAARIVATLAATDGDLTDTMEDALCDIFLRLDGKPLARAAVAERIRGAVSDDIASEVLTAQRWLDTEAREFILHCCYLLLEAMDDPGEVQEELLVKVAAAMGMSELDLKEHYDDFEIAAVPASPFGATDRKA